MVILETSSDRIMGLAQLCLANFVHGTAQLAGLLRNEFIGRVWPVEGFVLFINYAFYAYPLRKLYAEVPEVNDELFGSGLSRLFTRQVGFDEEWPFEELGSVAAEKLHVFKLENNGY